ncbi:TlpA family protein disulfide reductase [Mangrovimonas xylaniphaga]|uniref:TlpA family protein disulfide reductase n=1 Tax=Mangrovimonas xylaniphaga TaxID=1645915 RepID=UPI0006B52CB0|nr:TlpA disulfide reductase family protein [Mangrovimonas xylaniphaga]
MNRTFNIPLLLLIALLFFRCNPIKKTPKYTGASNEVNLYSGDTLFKTVLLDYAFTELDKPPYLLKSIANQESLNFSFDLDGPKLFRFYGYDPQSYPFYIYVTPGDSLSYRLENQMIVFEGRNAAHYNFFKTLFESKFSYAGYDEELGLNAFKQQTKDIYQERLQVLEAYVKKENTSQSFYSSIKEVLRFEYINWLFNRNMIPIGAITDYSTFLEGVTMETFNRNDQADNPYFYLALIKYVYLVSEEKFGEANASEALQYQLQLIDENLQGLTKEYALTKIISDYDGHIRPEDINDLLEVVAAYLPKINDETYKGVLEKIEVRLGSFDKQLTEAVNKAVLLDREGRQVTFNEVLESHEGKYKVIDFWASWCVPCIKEIKEGHLFREKITKNKNVEFLYVSIDKDRDKWMARGEELKVYGMLENQYVIVGDEHDILRSFFNVVAVPHYAVLDENNEVLLFNAPTPVDTPQFMEVFGEVK